ncbi:ABC transporter ATP-binding protein [Halostagnicola sp. A-GB9-2]|uniref:ABC transporter ATP-binding protein n=1 Tax=Halostagnicola sp. A-GB9-2 TaxID=3048066 RepID=UPI0024BF4209|nr:ABC transporter ATP-binding protein [Halostagnicola sp. A-GB9-2]MDJ1433666.1 ABC transporter ATP-binding protein [Halostagnicola sp. A-GB9-2]
MSDISFESVRKVYNEEIIAVDDFDLTIEDGEFVSIVGPSGSGKSTLLRMIAGLEEISSGTIAIGDRPVNEIPPQHRGVAMVFQNYALYPHMNVRKNMSYGLKLTSDLPKDDVRERVEEAAEMMGIEDLLNKRPSELSGGQQQRVATGRAIVRDPEVFLMDEPLSNLDAKLRLHMRTELQRIQDDLETTTVYVTHDQEEALTMSDRIVVLDAGDLQQVGTPEEVFEQPANLFVARFIGSPTMNFLEVSYDEGALVGDGFSVDLPAAMADRIETGRSGSGLRLGIRPAALSIADETDECRIPAEIDVVEPAGSDTYVYLERDGAELTVRTESSTEITAQGAVEATFDVSDIHVFDIDSEQNLLLDEGEDVSIEATASSASSASKT